METKKAQRAHCLGLSLSHTAVIWANDYLYATFSTMMEKTIWSCDWTLAFVSGDFWTDYLATSIDATTTALSSEDLLFGGVVELVFVGSSEALLDPDVRPQPLHARQQLLRERLSVLHARHHVHHHFGIALQRNANVQPNHLTQNIPLHERGPFRLSSSKIVHSWN